MYWGEKTTETATNYVHKDTSWFLLLVSAYQNKLESGSPGCWSLFNYCQLFFEQISPPQSIKIFLPFPVAKMLHILIFSIGLFHLTSKNYCSTRYRHGLKKAVCNQRITVWTASELSKASSSKDASISSYLLKKEVFYLYIKILFFACSLQVSD